MSKEREGSASVDRDRDPTALFSGLLFIALGAGFLLIGSDYAFGTTRAMGPGFFPQVLAMVLIALGAIVAFSGRSGSGEVMGSINWKGLILIPLAALAFALLVRPAGIVPAVFLSVFIATIATPRFDWRKALVTAAALAVFSALVFVTGLGLPIPIIGPWFSFV